MSIGAPGRLEALTGIRGIAAWAVVLYHVRFSLAELVSPAMIAALGKGYLAVDLFFVLSGFVIWHTYAARLGAGGLGEAWAFLWRRFARVWPLHAVVLGGFIALALALAATGRNTAGYPWAELPLHILLLQNWGFTNELSWNHPAWSISTELAAYLLFPAIVMSQPRGRLPDWALIAIAAGLALALHGLFALNGETSLGARIETFGIWRCLAEFAMGNVLCALWQRWSGKPWAARLAGLACALLLGAGWLLDLAETAFVPAATFAGLLALALDRGLVARLLGGRVIGYLGELSYSTYLAHFGLFIVFKLAFVDASLQIGWGQLAGFLALVFVSSALLYHGLEKPAQRWLNRNAPRWAVPAPLPAE